MLKPSGFFSIFELIVDVKDLISFMLSKASKMRSPFILRKLVKFFKKYALRKFIVTFLEASVWEKTLPAEVFDFDPVLLFRKTWDAFVVALGRVTFGFGKLVSFY
jgi:hypothetical protein